MKIHAALLYTIHCASGFVIQAPRALYKDGAITRRSFAETPLHAFSLHASVGGNIPKTRTFAPVTGGSAEIKNSNIQRGGTGSADIMRVEEGIWDSPTAIKVQGGALRTWSFESPAVQFVQVLMKTAGRPLNANVDLWQGPDNSPQKMGVYIEDGSVRPFSAVIATPRDTNVISIRNTAPLEYPLYAIVEADYGSSGLGLLVESYVRGRIVQGGAVYTVPFDFSVESVSVLLKTDGRPLNARIELLRGPNTLKQVMEVYTEDGLLRPFFAVVETPGTGNVVRIVNTATVEFPIYASIEPYQVEPMQP